MKLTTTAVIAFAAAAASAFSIPYKGTTGYARDSSEGVLEPFEKHIKRAPQAYSGGYATYFYQGGVAGACGNVHSDNDPVAAIAAARYGAALCGKKVKITNPSNGKSVVVTIADKCPGCRNGNSIDLSLSAFKSIADLSQGVVGINWVFV